MASGFRPAPVASGGGPPTGAAGGQLSGTYPNPQIALATITNINIALATILGANIANDTITNDNIAPGSIEPSSIDSASTFSGNINVGPYVCNVVCNGDGTITVSFQTVTIPVLNGLITAAGPVTSPCA